MIQASEIIYVNKIGKNEFHINISFELLEWKNYVKLACFTTIYSHMETGSKVRLTWTITRKPLVVINDEQY